MSFGSEDMRGEEMLCPYRKKVVLYPLLSPTKRVFLNTGMLKYKVKYCLNTGR